MIANYHTHSRWCNHAEGEIEDYFKKAVELGFKELAMTEHVPHRNSWCWYPVELIPEYDAALNSAISKYQDKIKLYKGFECEYHPDDLEDYLYYKKELGYDFLILGQHGFGKNNEINSFAVKNSSDMRKYADTVCEGLETGIFVMLAHPDVVMSGYKGPFDRDCEEAFRQIFKVCEKLRIPLEINMNGFRDNRGYPDKDFLILSKDYELKYLINSDAHSPKKLYDEAGHELEKWVEGLGITVEELFPWDYSKSRIMNTQK